MRFILPILSAFVLSASAALANPAPPFVGTADKMVFVSETRFVGTDGNQNLCVPVVDHHVFFLPVRRVVGDYVFSDGPCDTGAITPIPADRFPLFLNAGVVPADVPVKPSVTIAWSAGQMAIFILGLFVLAAIPVIASHRIRSKFLKVRQISGDPLFFDVLLSVMFHTARTDGVIEKDELAAIQHIYSDMTGIAISPDVMASKFTETLSEDTILKLAQGFSGREAETILDAAILVATQKGRVTREKMNLLIGLNGVLERDASWFRDTLNAALALKNPQQA
ncbi:MAG: hypothetical protein AAFP98_12080 [Pseudomonadota bacterium]